jgi:tRNA-dihydrouridine synthase
MQTRISLAPLQGLTDFIFRNSFEKFFTGLDLTYSPFIRIERGEVRRSKLRDIDPENNSAAKLIPQILTNKAEEFIYLANMITEMGYEEINWNLGCPFPMIARHNLGSGMLKDPKQIDDMLTEVLSKISCKLSIKVRSGYENETDLIELLPLLNKHSLTEIIIHPRTGLQQYKGDVNREVFEKCIPLTKHKLTYNGDINSIKDYNNFRNKFSSTDSIMIGRGIIANPFLAMDIKGITIEGDRLEIFKQFHGELLLAYSDLLNGDMQILKRMQGFWEYFSLSFTNSRKVLKKIKKTTNASKYINAVNEIFREEEWIA